LLSSSISFTLAGGHWALASGATTVTAAAAVVPEPASLALGATGFLLVGLCGWRARKKQP
jgi:hypothetical protein